jgi:hypothetical protein
VDDLNEILSQINEKKLKMSALWETRGKTDPEILGISVEIDDLLNKYYRLKL